MPTVSVNVTVCQDQNEKKFSVESGKIIYDQLEQQGLALPHGCLAGSCGSCKIEILHGAENLSPPSVVESDTLRTIMEKVSDKKIVLRLSCRAKLKGSGDVMIRPFKV